MSDNEKVDLAGAVELKRPEGPQLTEEQLAEIAERTEDRYIRPVQVKYVGSDKPDLLSLNGGELKSTATHVRVNPFVQDPNNPGKTMVDRTTLILIPLIRLESVVIQSPVKYPVLKELSRR